LSVKDIDIEQVDKIIVVDTNSKSRLEKPLGKLFEKPGVDIVVYDHHPPSENMIEARKAVIEDIGSCTALLVDEIQSLILILLLWKQRYGSWDIC